MWDEAMELKAEECAKKCPRSARDHCGGGENFAGYNDKPIDVRAAVDQWYVENHRLYGINVMRVNY